MHSPLLPTTTPPPHHRPCTPHHLPHHCPHHYPQLHTPPHHHHLPTHPAPHHHALAGSPPPPHWAGHYHHWRDVGWVGGLGHSTCIPGTHYLPVCVTFAGHPLQVPPPHRETAQPTAPSGFMRASIPPHPTTFAHMPPTVTPSYRAGTPWTTTPTPTLPWPSSQPPPPGPCCPGNPSRRRNTVLYHAVDHDRQEARVVCIAVLLPLLQPRVSLTPAVWNRRFIRRTDVFTPCTPPTTPTAPHRWRWLLTP